MLDGVEECVDVGKEVEYHIEHSHEEHKLRSHPCLDTVPLRGLQIIIMLHVLNLKWFTWIFRWR